MKRSPLRTRSRSGLHSRRPGQRNFRPFLEQLEERACPAPLMVTTDLDSGTGSLREAIALSNLSVGVADSIEFNIPGSGVHTISLLSPLPTITHPVTIDGYTQPGASPNTAVNSDNAVLQIELDGSQAGNTNLGGLFITAGNCTVKGLVINRFLEAGATGIWMQTGGHNFIEGNFIGTDPTGMADLGNGLEGVRMDDSANNQIGGTTLAARNIISGNNRDGVFITDSDGTGKNSTLNMIAGNFIGIDAFGTGAVGNGGDGVDVLTGVNNTLGGVTSAERNVISGNGGGVRIAPNGDGISGVKVQGNYIGTNAAGTAAVPNLNGAIEAAGTVLIGGMATAPGTAPGNLISGNHGGNTILFDGGGGGKLQGNLIGTDVSGTLDLGNQGYGVNVGRASNVKIGGTSASERNVISANGGSGISISSSASAIVVQGNYIGTGITGTQNLANGTAGAGGGIQIDGSGNTIGSPVGNPTAGAGNVIAHNLGDGVRIIGLRNSVLGNSIFGNQVSGGAAGLGITFTDAGPTANDPGDGDTGGNNWQNFPVISSALVNASGTTIAWSLNSTPNTSFTLDFYASAAADPSGYGEGQTWLGETSATTDANGNVSFEAAFDGGLPVGQTVITATATDASGNTSEFSQVKTAVISDITPPTVTINQAASQVDPTNAGSIQFSVLFSEAVTGFTASDVLFATSTVGGTLAASVSGTGASYTVSVTGMTGSGPVVVSIGAGAALDAAGNASLASMSTDNTVSFDNVAPTVTINQAKNQADPINASPIQFTVLFSESVTGFAAGDISFVGSAIGGTLVASVSGTGAAYTVSVTGMAGNGTVVASIGAGAATDAAGNASLASTTTDNTVTFDNVAPSVTINQAASQVDPTNAGSIQFSVLFSEAVTGFTGSDVSFVGSSIGGALVAGVTGSGTTYTVSVTGMSGNGTVVASIGAGAAIDGAGNGSTASTSTDHTVTFDNVAPTVTINQAASQVDPVTAGPVQFSVVFSEAVTGFTGSDVSFVGSSIGGALVAGVTGSGTTYTVSVTGMTGSGTVVASIGAGAATDAAGNGNLASTSVDNTVIFNNVAATITVLTATPNPSTFGADVTFTANVTTGTPSVPVNTGSVTFIERGNILSGPTNLNSSGVATFTLSTLSVGADTITAEYNGTENFTFSSGSIKQTVQAAPHISINDVFVKEGNSGVSHVVFLVSLSSASPQTVTVAFATTDNTAMAADHDYVTKSGTLVFEPGQTVKTISVDVNGDLLHESAENFFVGLSNANGASIGDALGVGTIENDDPVPSLTISDAIVREPDTGTTHMLLSVRLSAPSGETVTVDYATQNISALARKDYVASSGTLTFAPGEQVQTITVQVRADTLLEPVETFSVDLSAATHATILGGQGIGTIYDSSAPKISGFPPFPVPVGITVVITGHNFTGVTSVALNGTAVAFTAVTPTLLRFTVPHGASTGPISITNSGGTGVSENAFVVLPQISSFTPGTANVGRLVTVNGSGFLGATAVSFNGTAATSFTVLSPNSLQATVPSGATSGHIHVRSSSVTVFSPTVFHVGNSISIFTPSQAPVGTSVTITGEGLNGTTSVKFDMKSASFSVLSPTSIRATVPQNATTGRISVTTPAGTVLSVTNFSVLPRISSLTRTSGKVGTSVTISGSGFSGVTSVSFGGTPATFSLVSPTTIHTTVPGTAVTGPISVTTPGGSATTSIEFRVLPSITSFQPASGAVGTLVTINGGGFGSGSSAVTLVEFNGTRTTSITLVSPTQIQVIVPQGATSGPVNVTTPAGTVASATKFLVLSTGLASIARQAEGEGSSFDLSTAEIDAFFADKLDFAGGVFVAASRSRRR